MPAIVMVVYKQNRLLSGLENLCWTAQVISCYGVVIAMLGI